MAKISLIVAVDEQGGIGKGQDLLCHLPEDLAFFKQQTMGKPMIMGRKTYESIGRPLPGRQSIVLTTSFKDIPGVDIVATPEQALQLCASAREIMVIGGSSVYREFLPLAQRIYMTVIHHSFEADVYFPYFDPILWSRTILREFTANEKTKYNLTFICLDKISSDHG